MTVRIRLSLVLLMLLMPALALAGDKDNNDEPHGKRAGSAFAPAYEGRSAGETQQQSKRCMKICEHWTKDCIVDRQGNRKCRRSCEQLGEHCF